MPLTREEILHVARLARLELADSEVETLGGQLAAVLDYVASLSRADTEGVQPSVHAASGGTPLREDGSRPGLPREEALAAAPAADGVYFKVPRVVQR